MLITLVTTTEIQENRGLVSLTYETTEDTVESILTKWNLHAFDITKVKAYKA